MNGHAPADYQCCPGCGRRGAECWASPCLYLEMVKRRPLKALRDWCAIVGGTLKSKGTNQ